MYNSDETAVKLLEKWSTNRANSTDALVVGLSGHLGAGKTAFVKRLAAKLGITEDVTSPTFVIMKIYDTTNDTFRRLIHIDAYRLEERSQLEALRFEDVVSDSHNLVMIEWPENVQLGQDDLDEWLKLEITEGKYLLHIK